MTLGAGSFLNSLKNSVISQALTGGVNSLSTTYTSENGGSYIIHDNTNDVDYFFNHSDNSTQGWDVERVDSQGNSSTTSFWPNLNSLNDNISMQQVGTWQDQGKTDKTFEEIASLKINPNGRDENGVIGTCRFGSGIELEIMKTKGEAKYQMYVPGHHEAGIMVSCEIINGEIVLTSFGKQNVVQLAEGSNLLGDGGDGNYKFIDTDGHGFEKDKLIVEY